MVWHGSGNKGHVLLKSESDVVFLRTLMMGRLVPATSVVEELILQQEGQINLSRYGIVM